jgi:hypothetical protein
MADHATNKPNNVVAAGDKPIDVNRWVYEQISL